MLLCQEYSSQVVLNLSGLLLQGQWLSWLWSHYDDPWKMTTLDSVYPRISKTSTPDNVTFTVRYGNSWSTRKVNAESMRTKSKHIRWRTQRTHKVTEMPFTQSASVLNYTRAVFPTKQCSTQRLHDSNSQNICWSLKAIRPISFWPTLPW